jgi:hypothetical protein
MRDIKTIWRMREERYRWQDIADRLELPDADVREAIQRIREGRIPEILQPKGRKARGQNARRLAGQQRDRL